MLLSNLLLLSDLFRTVFNVPVSLTALAPPSATSVGHTDPIKAHNSKDALVGTLESHSEKKRSDSPSYNHEDVDAPFFASRGPGTNKK